MQFPAIHQNKKGRKINIHELADVIHILSFQITKEPYSSRVVRFRLLNPVCHYAPSPSANMSREIFKRKCFWFFYNVNKCGSFRPHLDDKRKPITIPTPNFNISNLSQCQNKRTNHAQSLWLSPNMLSLHFGTCLSPILALMSFPSLKLGLVLELVFLSS